MDLQVILPNDQTLVAEHEVLVQHPPTVRWASADDIEGLVQPLIPKPSFDDWVRWADQAGGQWASAADIQRI